MKTKATLLGLKDGKEKTIEIIWNENNTELEEWTISVIRAEERERLGLTNDVENCIHINKKQNN